MPSFPKARPKKIPGVEPEETQVFLEELLEFAIRPAFVYVRKYKLGAMLIIDDRSKFAPWFIIS